MTCNCDKKGFTKEQSDKIRLLKAQGEIFMRNAREACNSCDKMVVTLGVKRCGICSCPISFKIVAGALQTTHCPDTPPKW